MFFSDVAESLKKRGFVPSNGEDDFEKFLISSHIGELLPPCPNGLKRELPSNSSPDSARRNSSYDIIFTEETSIMATKQQV
jgi:hypothetical protein